MIFMQVKFDCNITVLIVLITTYSHIIISIDCVIIVDKAAVMVMVACSVRPGHWAPRLSLSPRLTANTVTPWWVSSSSSLLHHLPSIDHSVNITKKTNWKITLCHYGFVTTQCKKYFYTILCKVFLFSRIVKPFMK